MKNIESFEDFVNESYNLDNEDFINEDLLNESKNYKLKKNATGIIRNIFSVGELYPFDDKEAANILSKIFEPKVNPKDAKELFNKLEDYPENIESESGIVAWIYTNFSGNLKESADDEVNEAKKIKPFNKVKVGDKAEDYHGDIYNVIAKGKMKDLKKYDNSGTAGDFLEPDEDVIALDDKDGTTAVFTYGGEGAAVYEAKSDTVSQSFEYGEEVEDALNDASIKTYEGEGVASDVNNIIIDKKNAKKANAILKKINAYDDDYNFIDGVD